MYPRLSVPSLYPRPPPGHLTKVSCLHSGSISFVFSFALNSVMQFGTFILNLDFSDVDLLCASCELLGVYGPQADSVFSLV